MQLGDSYQIRHLIVNFQLTTWTSRISGRNFGAMADAKACANQGGATVATSIRVVIKSNQYTDFSCHQADAGNATKNDISQGKLHIYWALVCVSFFVPRHVSVRVTRENIQIFSDSD